MPVPDRREIRALNGKEGLIVSQGLLQDLAHVVRLRDEVTRGSALFENDGLHAYHQLKGDFGTE